MQAALGSLFDSDPYTYCHEQNVTYHHRVDDKGNVHALEAGLIREQAQHWS